MSSNIEIPRLYGDYIRGYTRAIMDIIKIFDYANYDLACHHKRMNYKLSKELLNCILENREVIRESEMMPTDRSTPFIRWTNDGGFELYRPSSK